MSPEDEQCLSKVKLLAQRVWKVDIEESHIFRWLDNFETTEGRLSEEQSLALYLLSNFLFFNVKEIRELLRSLYRDKIMHPMMKNCREKLGGIKDVREVRGQFVSQLEKTRILGVGNPSESGTHLLYFFRQENSLSKNIFISGHRIFQKERVPDSNEPIYREPDVERYIFIDDLCGTGTQALEYSEELVSDMKKADFSKEVSYLTLFATEEGLDKVRSSSLFDRVDCVYEFDNTFRCFSDESRYFLPNLNLPYDKEKAKQMSAKYGMQFLCDQHNCLGYKNSQLLLGFYHNVPDNTLQIFWQTMHDWYPIFRRYGKME